METSLDLATLVDALRAKGFRIDTGQYLSANDLLLRSAALGRRLEDDPAALRSHLGPIFCASSEEQTRFADVMKQWQGGADARIRAKPLRAPRPFATWNRWRWLSPTLVIFCVLMLVTLIGWYWYFAPSELRVTVQVAQEKAPPQAAPNARLTLDGERVALDQNAQALLRMARKDGTHRLTAELAGYEPTLQSISSTSSRVTTITLTPVVVPMVDPNLPLVVGSPTILLPPSTEVQAKVMERSYRAISLYSSLPGLAVFGLLALGAWRRRQLVLQRLPTQHRPDYATLDIITPSDDAPGELRRTATALRRFQRDAIADLDATASIERTAQCAGLFTPVFASRRRAPEYLVLIERVSEADHLAWAHGKLIANLAHQGVHAEVYWFRDDPRTCYQEVRDELQFRPFSRLLAMHHRATLLVFLDAERCFNPLSGRLQPWVEAGSALQRRCLFTPKSPYYWTAHERKLAKLGYVVLPAGAQGLLDYANIEAEWNIDRLFPADYARPYPPLLLDGAWNWLAPDAPAGAIMEELLRQLRDYLGPDGLRWLCACAVYPELNPALTLDLGNALEALDPSEVSESHRWLRLLDLARLPWARHGHIPEWLRHLLIAQLSPEQHRIVRTCLQRRLEQLAQRTLDSAGASPADRLRIARLTSARDIVESAAPEDPMRDTVFLGFVSGKSMDTLSMEAPAQLKGLFSELDEIPPNSPAAKMSKAIQGLRDRLLGWGQSNRPALRALLGVLTSAAAFGLALWLVPPEKPVSRIADHSITDISFDLTGAHAAIAREDGSVEIWQMAGYTAPLERWNMGEPIRAIALRPDARQVAVAMASGRVRRFERGANLGVPFPEGGIRVLALAYSPDGNWLAGGRIDGKVSLWQSASSASAQGSSALGSIDSAVTSLAFRQDSSAVASTHQNGAVELLNLQGTSRPLAAAGQDEASRLQWTLSADQSTIASGAQDGSVRFRRIAKAKSFETREHAGLITSIGTSANGKWVASGSVDKTLRVWSADTGRSVLTPLSVDGAPRVIVFRPDGKQLATAVGEKLIMWPVQERDRTPEGLSLRATPQVITAGQSSELCYEMRRAVRASISPEVGDIKPTDRGCVTVRPMQTVTYLLRAVGNDGSESSVAVTVQVNAPIAATPVRIARFDATPQKISRGESARLCYDVRNAARAQIDPPLGKIDVRKPACITVKPDTNTEIIMTAYGADKTTITSRVRIIVMQFPAPMPAAQAPRIRDFIATPASIRAGQSARLCYGIENARGVFIQPEVGQVKSNTKDCVEVRPKISTTYTLRAENGSAPAATQEVVVQVTEESAEQTWCCIRRQRGQASKEPIQQQQVPSKGDESNAQYDSGPEVLSTTLQECRKRRGIPAKTEDEARAICSEQKLK